VLHGSQDLGGELCSLVLRDPPAGLGVEDAEEVPAGAQLEDHVQVPRVLVGLEEADYVGVVDLPQNIDLALVVPSLFLRVLLKEEGLEGIIFVSRLVFYVENFGGSPCSEGFVGVDLVGFLDLGTKV